MNPFYLIAAALPLLLGGCEKSPSEAQTSAPSASEAKAPGAGSIKVTPPKTKPVQTTGDAFRTLDIKGESTIQYAPQGAEVTQAVKNVQVAVAVRNSPYASIQGRLMQQRLSKEFIVACSACHDDYANGVIGPSLIGKNAPEVREMIDKYAKDPNANVLMTSLIERMTTDEIDFIAKDIARFNAEIQKETPATASLRAPQGEKK